MNDETAAPVCLAPGPGLVPDPAVTCQRTPGHEADGLRHSFEGVDNFGNPVRTEWGSTGPSVAICGELPILPFGPGLPTFHCTLSPGHGMGSHEWNGVSDVGTPVQILWSANQLVAQLGAPRELGTPAPPAPGAQPTGADANFDPEAAAAAPDLAAAQAALDAREAAVAAREAALNAPAGVGVPVGVDGAGLPAAGGTVQATDPLAPVIDGRPFTVAERQALVDAHIAETNAAAQSDIDDAAQEKAAADPPAGGAPAGGG